MVSFEVVCDLTTERGGWIIFQRRYDGSENFYRPWKDYKNGFGDLTGEHWLGLEKLHRLTRNGVWQLRVELEDCYGNTSYAEYSNFAIGDETSSYRLTAGEFFGTAEDGLVNHENMPFSTYDQDHDALRNNCAQDYQTAWWFGSCHGSNLNGPYTESSQTFDRAILSNSWMTEPLKISEMKIRRIW